MEDYDLSSFGWDGCSIPTNLHSVCERLPTWKHIKLLRTPHVAKEATLYFPHTFFKPTGKTPYMPSYIKGTLENDGGYAQIFKGKRAIFRSKDNIHTGPVSLTKVSPFSEVCIKEVRLNITPEEDVASPHTRANSYEDEINAILYEVFLHGLLYKTLEKEGFPSVVPYLHEVVGHTKNGALPISPTDFKSLWICMEFLSGTTLEKYLRRNLRIPTGPEGSAERARMIEANETILIDVFIQLAFYLHVLQEKLRFNHRDMKINNVYIRHHESSETWSRVITIPGLGSWNCLIDLVMIDFGFACISCGEGFLNPRATLVGAGSWFRTEHDCLKYGRDLGQFLYSLHCSFPLSRYISSAFFLILSMALRATKGSVATGTKRIDLLKGFDPSGKPIESTVIPATIKFNDGIYLFLREADVDVPDCRPKEFLRLLHVFRPEKLRSLKI